MAGFVWNSGPSRGRLSGVPETIERLEPRSLLADGIAPAAGAPLTARAGVPLTNVVVAAFTVTDPSGAPGTKWLAKISWGDGLVDMKVAPVQAGGTFEFLGAHT